MVSVIVQRLIICSYIQWDNPNEPQTTVSRNQYLWFCFSLLDLLLLKTSQFSNSGIKGFHNLKHNIERFGKEYIIHFYLSLVSLIRYLHEEVHRYVYV